MAEGRSAPRTPVERLKGWILWVLATMAGSVVGWGVWVVILAAAPAYREAPVVALVNGGAFGAAVGLGQWLVLRHWVSGAGWWVMATVVGGVIMGGVNAFGATTGGIDRFVFGPAIGLCQWLALRHWVRAASWWILATAVAWALAWAVRRAVAWEGAFALEMVVVATVSGGALMYLLAQADLDEARIPRTWTGWVMPWAFWVVGTTLGTVMPLLFLWPLLEGRVGVEPGPTVVAGACFGASVGLGQCLVLKRWVKGAGWWILATALPFAVFGGVAASGVPQATAWPDWVGFGVQGAFLGLSQWLVLRQWVKRAGWWIPVSAVVWALSSGMESPIELFPIGAITGVAMMLLLAQKSRY